MGLRLGEVFAFVLTVVRCTDAGVGRQGLLVVALLVQAAPAWAGSVSRLTPWVQQCFADQGGKACVQALLQAEALQQRAADLDRYPCQSMVLGLQAEVVMVQLQSGRGRLGYETLSQMQQRCSGL